MQLCFEVDALRTEKKADFLFSLFGNKRLFLLFCLSSVCGVWIHLYSQTEENLQLGECTAVAHPAETDTGNLVERHYG